MEKLLRIKFFEPYNKYILETEVNEEFISVVNRCETDIYIKNKNYYYLKLL